MSIRNLKGDTMTILQRIAREPNAIAGVVIAAYSVLVAFEIIHLTAIQTGALGGLGGAAVLALRWLVTPASEVVAQQKPDEVIPVAGPALKGVEDGSAVYVHAILGKA